MSIIERLKELQAKATPGPWKIHKEDVGDEDFIYIPTGIIGGNGVRVVGSVGGLCSEDCDLGEGELEANSELITLLRNTLPALLEVVEAVDKMLPEVDDFLFCFDEEQAIWTSYMSRLGDLLDKLEATP